MRLSKLTVNGFKSFADKTDIAFDAPLVGIVGPNGCGKSNVVDAIKWVLGEQSAKSLRGGAMLDVIFNGSASRKPAGMASVTLHFENPATETGGRALPLEADTVAVTRRLFRDGTSEYLVNNQRARLRDIRGLFYDTGIGSHGYCIIEQGKVDAMLVTNPVERRAIFEEAAGISKFRAQKKESARKLERTEQNLLRCRDKFEEVQRRLRSVKVQATRARNFQEYSQKLRELQLEYFLAEYHRLKEHFAAVAGRLEEAEQDRRKAVTQLTAAEDQRSTAEAERASLLARQRELEQESARLQSLHDQAVQRRQFAESTLADIEQQVDAETRHKAEVNQKAAELETQSAQQLDSLTGLQQQVAEAEARITQATEQHRTHQYDLNEATAKLEDEKAGIVNLLRRTTDLHNRIGAIDVQEKNLIVNRDRLTTRADQLAAELRRLLTERDEATARLLEAVKLIDTEKARLEEQKTALADLSDAQRRLTQQLASAKEQRSGLASRRSTLDELEQSQTGVDDAVKAVLARKASSSGQEFGFVRGLVADLVSTDIRHAAMVEAALNGHQQTLIVDRLSDLAEHAAELRTLAGRVTFLPLDQFPPVRFDAEAVAQGYERIVDLIRFDPVISPLVWNILGRTLVVEDVSAACRLRETLPTGYRFVTREGILVESDGRVHAGPLDTHGTGLISRRSELAELQGRLESLDQAIAADQTHLEQLSDRAAHVERTQQELRQAIYEAGTMKVELSSKADSARDAIARIEREQPVIATEVEQIHHQLTEAAAQRDTHRLSAEALERESMESQQRAHALDAQIGQLRVAADQAAEAVTTARVESGKLAEQLAAAQKHHRQIELAHADAQRQVQLIAQRIDEHHRRMTDLLKTRDEAGEQITSCESRITELAGELSGFASRLEEVANDLGRLTAAVRDHRQAAEAAEQKLHQAEVERRELEVRGDSVRQRAAEQLSLELDQAYADYTAKQIDWDAIETQIAELKGKIDRLGSVNLDAINELADLETQEQGLRVQIEDVDKAKAELESLITHLDTESRNRFQQSFEQIREHFAAPDGLFRKLFGGGRADLLLIPDENGNTDWLESGIEVIAKPPGKEPQSIRLLSGGERTMVAVALLLSIFRSRPSPFCILDEVDAALDEANVDRFTNVIRSFLDRSHFIVITHHKRTMQAADMLYGITMPIRGVCKRVAVTFDQVGAHGRLSEEALQRAAEEAQAEPEQEDFAAELAPRVAEIPADTQPVG